VERERRDQEDLALQSASAPSGQGSAVDDESAHALALEHFAAYVDLLREATKRRAEDVGRQPYAVKLEFGDGRWTVDEVRLDARPQLGDRIEVATGVWQVMDTQLVQTPAGRKPPHEFFVCASAA
jgi:hypothetical protein